MNLPMNNDSNVGTLYYYYAIWCFGVICQLESENIYFNIFSASHIILLNGK